ncbi:MAG: DUF4988 domain-containing protein, partial [Clostridia bacterium]|nr:DUF4988 domain-containing protein [Clostridia bacterium]
VSCKDYSSDIENLQSQITSLSGNLDYLQSLINQGKVVTDVTTLTTAPGGIRITFSDGNYYDIWNGNDGADGYTPEIGISSSTGNWTIDGVDTGVHAQGDAGENGSTPWIDGDGYWRIGNDYVYQQDENGDYVLDDNGNKIKVKATGEDGQSVYIDDDGYWRYSDGSYVTDSKDQHVKASGDDGSTPWVDSDGYWRIGDDYVYERDANGDYVLDDNGEKIKVKATGDNGKDATSWTIGPDGYWYQDNVKTEYIAVPGMFLSVDEDGYWLYNGENLFITDEDGNQTKVKATGDNGSDGDTPYPGTDGYWHWKSDGSTVKDSEGNDLPTTATGESGKSYVCLPCPDDDGWFNLYKVTETTDEETGDVTYDYGDPVKTHFFKFAPTNVLTALKDGNWLCIYNYYTCTEDADGKKTYTRNTEAEKIFLGQELTSVAFVPEWIDSETGYPTTAPSGITSTTYSEDDCDDNGYFTKLSTTISSGDTELTYRINPSNAYIEGAEYSFISRTVRTRAAAADGAAPFTVVETTNNNDGTITLNVASTDVDSDSGILLAALQVKPGSNPDGFITSDYIRVKGGSEEEITPVLVELKDGSPIALLADANDTQETETTTLMPGFYPRIKGINDSQTEDTKFILDCLGLSEDNGGYTSDSDGNVTDCDLTGLENISFAYTGASWLLGGTDNEGTDHGDPLFALYAEVNGEAESLTDLLGSTDAVKYKVSLPSDFTINGVDQNQYIRVDYPADDSKLAEGQIAVDVINSNPLAYDTYPVVRVDAYIVVDGKDYLVASAYILFHITEGTTELTKEIDLNEVLNGGNPFYVHYRGIKTDYSSTGASGLDEICGMTFSQLYKQLAGVNEDVAAEDLLDYYMTYYYISDNTDETGATVNAYICANNGNDTWTYNHYAYSTKSWKKDTYNVTPADVSEFVTWWAKVIKEYPELLSYYSLLTSAVYQQHDGFIVELNVRGAFDDESKNVVSLGVDDSIHTQHEYPSLQSVPFPAVTDPNGNEYEADEYESVAEYICRFTITSKNNKVAPDITVTVNVYVVDDCEGLELNGLYKLPDPENYGLSEGDDAVLVKGTTENGKFENTTDVKEHFAGTSNIFDYGNEDQNVKSIAFSWGEGVTGVKPETITSNDSAVGLSEPIEGASVYKEMDYNEILDNGESCPSSYYIVFVNPFKKGEDDTVYLDDSTEETTADVKEPITVYDLSDNLILSYGEVEDGSGSTSTGWILGDAAATYGITDTDDITVTYELDEDADDWAYLQKNLKSNDNDDAVLSFDKDTGIVTWSNGGTTLVYSYSFDVKVTVNVANIAKFTFTTTVVLNPNSSYGPRPESASLSPFGANVVL